MQSGDHAKAITMFDDILKKNPYNFSTLTSKGHAQKTEELQIKQLKAISLLTKLNLTTERLFSLFPI